MRGGREREKAGAEREREREEGGVSWVYFSTLHAVDLLYLHGTPLLQIACFFFGQVLR